ncbi:MAG: ATP synthase F1 subunit delta [Thermodesulfobacteriota bacterium]
MPRISSGKRYAQAAFELALEKNQFEVWQEGLERMANLAADQKLMALLNDPRIPFDAKKDLLQRALGEIPPLVFNLALLLMSKGMLSRCRNIYNQYNHMLDLHRGVERARVKTAVPLDPEEREIMSRHLREIVDRKVVIDGELDPSIIGGFIARMGDMLIDGSIRQQLETLKRNLVEAGK